MNFEKYIDEITQLIKINNERLTLESWPKNIHYSISGENLFKLTYSEYQALFTIVEEISSDLNLEDTFPKKFIFDKLVREVIIKSYDYSSTTSEIKSNLKDRFQELEDILNEELNDWTYFIPISGIVVEDIIDFGEILFYPFNSFKQEFLDYLINVKKMSMDDWEYKVHYEELDELKSFCFAKLTVNGTEETSRDKALSKVNEFLSIFSFYKPLNYYGFGIMGEVLPFDSNIVIYSRNLDTFKILLKRTVRAYSFNLSERLEHMKKYHLDYLISLTNRTNISYVEKCLLNSLQWYYESVKIEVDFDKSTTETTLISKDYYEHYSYFKLGIKLINLVSALESLLVYERHYVDKKILRKRFNFVMNYINEEYNDYSDDFKEIYDLRNDIAHSNKLCNLIKFNIQKNTMLINSFIYNFIELKLDYCGDFENMDSKKDLERIYDNIG